MKKRGFLPSAFFVAGATTALFGAAAAGAQDRIEPHALPSVNRGEILVVAAALKAPADWVIVFWRASGADEFAAKRLGPGTDNTLEARIETAGINAPKIEYFFAYKSAAGITYLPPNPPAALFETALIGELPPQGAGALSVPAATPFPVRLDASADATITQQMSQPVSPDPGQTTNLGLAYTTSKDDFALDVQARASYTNRLLSNASAADLPDMRISVTKSSHAIRAGDLQIADSEFTTGGPGNRGIEYVFDNKSLYFHLFTAGTEQLQGFKGIGIPKAAASFFGGTAGFTLTEAVTVKAIYLSGQDDPALAANAAGAGGIMNKRAGDLMAIAGESRLFNSALTLSAEYARSNYDKDTSDDAGKVGSGAFRVGAALNLGIFDARIGYHDIGRDFNTIAQPFFINDRRRIEAGAGVTIKTVRLSGSWASERNNTADDPEVTTSKNILTQLDVAWQFLDSSSVRLGYGTSRQDARLNDNPVLQGNLLRTGFTGGLDVGITPLIRFSLTGQKDEIQSEDNPEVEGDSLGANLGVSIQAPDSLIFAPTFGLSRTKNKFTGESTLMLITALNADVTLVPKLFSVNVIGSLSRYDLGTGGVSNSSNFDGGLNLRLGKWIKIGEAVISLRAALILTRMGGQEIKDHRIFIKADISLGSGGVQ